VLKTVETNFSLRTIQNINANLQLKKSRIFWRFYGKPKSSWTDH